MKKTTDILFPVLILIALLLPSLYFVGVKENFVSRLAGAEFNPKSAPLSMMTYGTKVFQKNFDEIFAKNFFLRKSFFRCKNQIYAFINFGYFFAGAEGGPIFGNREGWLEGYSYMHYYFSNFKVDEKKYRGCFELIGKLAQEFKKKDIDFIYVLAPDKVFMYPERLSPMFSLFLKSPSGPTPYEQYGKILEKYHVPYMDSYTFLHQYKNSVELFPYRGVHWNAPAACLVFAEALRRLNKGKSDSDQYRIAVPDRFEATVPAAYCDNDVGNWRNLIWGASNSGLCPVFSQNDKKNVCNAIVLGDSFSEQISQALRHSRSFCEVVNYSNRIPTAEDFYKRLNGTKLVILVYTTQKLIHPVLRHSDLQKVYDMLCRYSGSKRLPLRTPVTFDKLDNYKVVLDGFSGIRQNGRWAGTDCILKLAIATDMDSPVQLTFNGFPVSTDQFVNFKNAEGQVFKTLALPRKGRYSVIIPPENISKDHVITLKLDFPNARRLDSPQDLPLISFFFNDIELSLKK